MRIKFLKFIGIISLTILLIGCNITIGNSVKNTVKKPDKIIIYNNGISRELEDSSSKYDEIVKLTNSRFNDKLARCKDVIDEAEADSIKKDELGIEFIYNNEQRFEEIKGSINEFAYYKMYFRLKSNNYGNEQGSPVHTLQYGDKEKYIDSSIGELDYSKQLIEIINKL